MGGMGTDVWKKAISPESQVRSVKESIKNPDASTIGSALLGGQMQHVLARSLSEGKREVAAEEAAEIEAAKTPEQRAKEKTAGMTAAQRRRRRISKQLGLKAGSSILQTEGDDTPGY
jgi:hypothetical protein